MDYFPENREDWTVVSRLVTESNRLYIATHVNPDGDAIGSVMALAGFMKNLGKQFRVINDAKTPETFHFLDPESLIETYAERGQPEDGPRRGDLVMFLDLGSYDRVGRIESFLVDNEAVKVVIDHHIPEPVDADYVIVNTSACSTGSLVFDFMLHCNRTAIDRNVASAVLTAIISDTGFFRYSNTTAATHQVVSALYDYGARTVDIRKNLESGQLYCRQKLLGLTLSKIQLTDSGRIAYSVITTGMFEDAGAQREHTEGIIDQLRIIRNIKVALLLIQEGPDFYKASFRTADTIPAHEIAARLGGGGHPKAAGASLHGPLDYVVSRVVGAIRDVLDEKES